MSRTRLIAGAAGAAVAATVTARLFSDRQRKARKLRRGDEIPFGSLHSPRRTVIATDGVSLNVEIDEGPREGGPTIVFSHGWMCSLDNWHFQRAALRGKARMVFFDHRSHGGSGRSSDANSTIEQLGRDLESVIDECAPDGDIILVGHSMGGMTIMSVAAQFPELFPGRIKGVVLCATGAGELMRGSSAIRYLRPIIARTTLLLDAGRTLNSFSVLRRFGLGPNASEKYVDMTEEMILKNSSHVLLDFYPTLLTLNLHDVLENMVVDHVTVIGGEKDLLTPIRHSRKLAELIDGAQLIELKGAGHMVMFEEHETVTAAIAEVLEAIS